MERSALDTLAKQLAAALRGDHEALCRHLIQELSYGRPVLSGRLASVLGISEAEVSAQLAHIADVERDDNGHIVGFGISLIPTPHRFLVNGRSLFTWCAFDALTYPASLQQSADVESHCPVTHQKITLTITPAGIRDVVPASTVISVFIPRSEDAHQCDRESFCKQGYFFASVEAAVQWQTEHQKILILPIEEAYELSRLVAHYRS
jgi:alkylmercury lyase